MNPTEPTPLPPLDPRPDPESQRVHRLRIMIVVILLLFAFEKIAESVFVLFYGDKARASLVAFDAQLRKGLEETSPWFLLRDFLGALKEKPVPKFTLPEERPRSSRPSDFIIGNETPRAASNPWELSPAAKEAVRMAEEARAQKAKKDEPMQMPSGNPITLFARVPGALMQVMANCAERGPIHGLLAIGSIVLGCVIVRPDKGWRWWLMPLVPLVAVGITAGLYFLAQAASATLSWGLSTPSVPVVIGTSLGILKIPFNMTVEHRVRSGVARLATLFRLKG